MIIRSYNMQWTRLLHRIIYDLKIIKGWSEKNVEFHTDVTLNYTLFTKFINEDQEFSLNA